MRHERMKSRQSEDRIREVAVDLLRRMEDCLVLFDAEVDL
jgi:hypothetical protein